MQPKRDDLRSMGCFTIQPLRYLAKFGINNSYIYVDNKLLLYIILYKRGGMFMLHSMRIR